MGNVANMQLTKIYLSETQIKQWLMMEFLNSIGAFDIKLGKIEINFDKEGRIGNVSITKNYKTEDYTPPVDSVI